MRGKPQLSKLVKDTRKLVTVPEEPSKNVEKSLGSKTRIVEKVG